MRSSKQSKIRSRRGASSGALNRALRAYDYPLRPNAIALRPAHPRDAARLLITRRGSSTFVVDRFYNLAKHLPPDALLVFNDTRVTPARLALSKPSGSTVRILVTGENKAHLCALADRPLLPGMRLSHHGRPVLRVTRRDENLWRFKRLMTRHEFSRLLGQAGETPLPPYLKHSPLTEGERRVQYQSIFAKRDGSIAAPTASLHFTKRLFADLKRHRIETAFLTLHVNLGTFAPLTDKELQKQKLHAEHYTITSDAAQRINRARRARRPIIAVGTTVMRALESASCRGDTLRAGAGTTQCFIRPGYRFRVTSGLITNFHVPQSSLLMLVAAFMEKSLMSRAYRIAQKSRFRFLSFGDGMLIAPRT